MNRRRFLKYAGATAAVAGGFVLGLDYFMTSRSSTSTQTTATTSTSKFNLPPIAQFSHTSKYLDPTDQQAIQFTNLSMDPDGDPLTYKWLVDNQPVSTEKDYVTKLPVGQHTIELEASDPMSKTTTAQTLNVEPDEIYPTKQMKIGYKGMKYAAGRNSPELEATPRVIPNHEKMNDQLGTIHDEIGCNAVYLEAGAEYQDNLFDACEIARQKQFDHIYACLKFMHLPLDETINRLENLALKMAQLREKSDSITWVIGSEFVFQIKDIIPGNTFQEQTAWMYANTSGYIARMRENIPQVFRRILPVIKANYPYPVAYAAEVNEAQFVPWNDPIFECVGADAYLQDAWGENEAHLITYFENLKRFGKPVIDFEFGCKTFKDAAACTECNHSASQDAAYDEDEQAKYVERYCNTLSKADITGAFYYIYNEEWDKGFGLYNGLRRKKGFYMYKSYQRAS